MRPVLPGLFSVALMLLVGLGVSGCHMFDEEGSEFSIKPGIWRLSFWGDQHDSGDKDNTEARSMPLRTRDVEVKLRFDAKDQEIVEMNYSGKDEVLKNRLKPLAGLIKENSKKNGRFIIDLTGLDEDWELRMWAEIENRNKVREGVIVGKDRVDGLKSYQGRWTMEKLPEAEFNEEKQ